EPSRTSRFRTHQLHSGLLTAPSPVPTPPRHQCQSDYSCFPPTDSDSRMSSFPQKMPIKINRFFNLPMLLIGFSLLLLHPPVKQDNKQCIGWKHLSVAVKSVVRFFELP